MPAHTKTAQKLHKKESALYVLASLFFAGVLFFALAPKDVFAVNKCKDIEDLDDRYECLKEEEESTSKKLSEVREKKEEVSGQIANLTSKLTVTQSEINELQASITQMIATLEQINENLEIKNIELSEKIAFRNKVIRDYSKRGVLNGLEIFMSTTRPSNLTGFQYSSLAYMFETALTSDTRRLIGSINTDITNFERDKKEAQDLKIDLEQAQANLLAAKETLESEKSLATEDFNVLAEKESSYEQKLADISAKQKEILAAKAGDGNGTVGDYDAPEIKIPSPPFKPAFLFASYGAYTHYNGLSQYGAKARANDGQSYKDIIEFYYDAGVDKKDDFPKNINVQGYGSMDFQKYLYGLAEMPSSWPEDALKAQAVAARSYAYRTMQGSSYSRDGGICTTQSCQVFLKSKSDNPPSSWKKAVDDTNKRIIDKDTGSAGYGWYSSTTGGYINNIGWDVDGSWPNDAYEKKAKSPWFRWAWYSQNYRFDSNKCGRDTPWLKESEMADILNSWVVWKNGSDSDRSRISPISSCWGGDPWSYDKMKDKAGDLGGSYSDVSDVDVVVGNNGRTQTVTFDTNRGKVSINGDEFKTVFNLRAPGYLSIRSRLFDAEYKN